MGQVKEAIADLTEAVRLDPTQAEACNLLGWLLSTCTEDSLRDGPRAVDLARKACELTNWKEPRYLDTLAAANAECGEFQQAVEWEKKAIELCEDQKKVEKFQVRLALYEQGRPYRHDGQATG